MLFTKDDDEDNKIVINFDNIFLFFDIIFYKGRLKVC
jgi:hypothetical protein